jgi:hypothetical protein
MSILQRNPVYVVGIGMHRYQFPTDTPYVQLGLTAVREALADARLLWPQVPLAVVGSAAIGMAAGRVMLRHLGSTGFEVMQVENASASGSTALPHRLPAGGGRRARRGAGPGGGQVRRRAPRGRQGRSAAAVAHDRTSRW